MHRALPALLASLAVLLAAVCSSPSLAQQSLQAKFDRFLETRIVPAARAAGVPQDVIRRELSGLSPDTSLDRKSVV